MPETGNEQSDTSPLREEILSDATKRAERTLKGAKADADKLQAEAKKKADQTTEETMVRAEERARERARVELATLPLERRRMELGARDQVVEEIFAESMEKLRAREHDAAEVIARLALAAAGEMSRTELVLRVTREDHELVDEAFIERLAAKAPAGTTFCRGEPLADSTGGVLVQTADAREVFDNTFEARLRRFRTDLRDEIASQLWGPRKDEENRQ